MSIYVNTTTAALTGFARLLQGCIDVGILYNSLTMASIAVGVIEDLRTAS